MSVRTLQQMHREPDAAHVGPYFYLPKMQSHLEARLWNSVFVDAQVPDPAFPVVGLACECSPATGCVLQSAAALQVPPTCTFNRGCVAPLQEALGIQQGTVKATVLIETLPAAFQMDEILYELRQVSSQSVKLIPVL